MAVSCDSWFPDPVRAWFAPGSLAGVQGMGETNRELQLLVVVLPMIAATTASPISRVPTWVAPSLQMSAVR